MARGSASPEPVEKTFDAHPARGIADHPGNQDDGNGKPEQTQSNGRRAADNQAEEHDRHARPNEYDDQPGTQCPVAWGRSITVVGSEFLHERAHALNVPPVEQKQDCQKLAWW